MTLTADHHAQGRLIFSDVVFGLIPAACLLPVTLLGVAFGWLLLLSFEGWAYLLFCAALAGYFGWPALFRAMALQWKGRLGQASRGTRLGLWCGLLGGLGVSAVYFLVELPTKGPLTFAGLLTAAYILLSPALLCAVYLRRLSLGGKP